MPEKIQEQFLDFLSRNFLVSRDEIILDESLIDQGIIDSFGLLEISKFLEREFFIVVTDKQMTRQNFGSVFKIVNFIKEEMSK
jgi:acyl carrier protein